MGCSEHFPQMCSWLRNSFDFPCGPDLRMYLMGSGLSASPSSCFIHIVVWLLWVDGNGVLLDPPVFRACCYYSLKFKGQEGIGHWLHQMCQFDQFANGCPAKSLLTLFNENKFWALFVGKWLQFNVGLSLPLVCSSEGRICRHILTGCQATLFKLLNHSRAANVGRGAFSRLVRLVLANGRHSL